MVGWKPAGPGAGIFTASGEWWEVVVGAVGSGVVGPWGKEEGRKNREKWRNSRKGEMANGRKKGHD